MKIAVLNTNGTQTTIQSKKKFYYVVEDDYDFSGNSATDITDINNSKLFFELLRFNYCEYRDTLITLLGTLTYIDLSTAEQIIFAKELVSDKVDRDVFHSDLEQEEFAVSIQEKLIECQIRIDLAAKANDLINQPTNNIELDAELPNYKELEITVDGLVNGTWHEITLPNDISANSVIIVSCINTKNIRSGGVREVGSTLDRRKQINSNASFTIAVKTNHNNKIEVYRQTKDVNFFISTQIS